MTFRNNLHVTYVFFLCIIAIRTLYVNKYTVACNARNSVAYTTRRRQFCFPVLIKVFLLDNNIQTVDTFHRCNVSRAVPAGRSSPRLFTLHYCTIVAVATSDTVALRESRRRAVPVDRHGLSNDIPHKEVIALSLSARPLAAAGVWTAQQPSSSLLNITVCAPIMLLRNGSSP